MRRILLWLACMLVGSITFVDAVVLIPPGRQEIILAVALSWMVTLAIGISLSAPAFIDSPHARTGPAGRLPPFLWLISIVVRALWWLGYLILRAIWSLIYLVWKP